MPVIYSVLSRYVPLIILFTCFFKTYSDLYWFNLKMCTRRLSHSSNYYSNKKTPKWCYCYQAQALIYDSLHELVIHLPFACTHDSNTSDHESLCVTLHSIRIQNWRNLNLSVPANSSRASYETIDLGHKRHGGHSIAETLCICRINRTSFVHNTINNITDGLNSSY